MLPTTPLSPRRASRVVRTVHQILVAVVVAWLPLLVFLDLPGETVAKISAGAIALVAAVAKTYNILWPAEDPLE